MWRTQHTPSVDVASRDDRGTLFYRIGLDTSKQYLQKQLVPMSLEQLLKLYIKSYKYLS